MERKYYQLPLDPVKDADILSYLNKHNRNTRPEFVKAAIREKENGVHNKELLESLEKVMESTIEKALTDKLSPLITLNKEIETTIEKVLIEKLQYLMREEPKLKEQSNSKKKRPVLPGGV